jgi:rhodanese-related sulfurtransferase
MKKFITTILSALAVLPPAALSYTDISADSLNAWIYRSAKPYLLDIRELNSYIARHIPGAALYPWDTGVFQARYQKLPSDRPIIVICETGVRAEAAAAFLDMVQNRKFLGSVFRLSGGMEAWNYEVFENDNRSFAGKKVLAEMFTTPDCDVCFYANQYLDEEFLPGLWGNAPFTFIRYRWDYPPPLPSVDFRAEYYQIEYVPTIVLNGVQQMYAFDFNEDSLFSDIHYPTPLDLEINGSPPDQSGLTKTRIKVTATPYVDSLEYNLFLILTETGLDTASFDPPFSPYNGETVFNQSMRLMVNSDSGTAFTIQPGEVLVFEKDFTMDPSWVVDSCEIIAFIQHLETRKILQADSRMIPELVPHNLPPSLRTGDNRTCFNIQEGDSLSIGLSINDPDADDLVTLTLSAWFSPDSTVFESYDFRNLTLLDSVLIFTPDSGQLGNYRFVLIGSDREGLSDTLEVHVSVAPLPVKCCDFSGNARVEVSDVIAFILLMKDDPDNPRLDWNGDGKATITDAVALLLDILGGKCPTPQGGGMLASAADNQASDRLKNLSRAEVEYIEQVIKLMNLLPEHEARLRAALGAFVHPSELPRAFSLSQNRPNPFNPVTAISYTVPETASAEYVSIKVFDIRGRLVRVLVDGIKTGGEYTVFWHGRDEAGRILPSGGYLYRMKSGDFTATRKMLLVK